LITSVRGVLVGDLLETAVDVSQDTQVVVLDGQPSFQFVIIHPLRCSPDLQAEIHKLLDVNDAVGVDGVNFLMQREGLCVLLIIGIYEHILNIVAHGLDVVAIEGLVVIVCADLLDSDGLLQLGPVPLKVFLQLDAGISYSLVHLPINTLVAS
jgi:hypothetical protein